MLHLQQFVLSQSLKEMKKNENTKKWVLNHFAILNQRQELLLFKAVVSHESKVFIQ